MIDEEKEEQMRKTERRREKKEGLIEMIDEEKEEQISEVEKQDIGQLQAVQWRSSLHSLFLLHPNTCLTYFARLA